MKITVTFMNHRQSVDYQLDCEMLIKDALNIIKNNDDFFVPKNIRYIYSKRKEEMINVLYSFKQAKIYTGDIIKIHELKNTRGKVYERDN